MKRNLLKIVTLCAAVALCLSAVLCFGLTASAATTAIYDADVSTSITIGAGSGAYLGVADADAAIKTDYQAKGMPDAYIITITATSNQAASVYPCIVTVGGTDIWAPRGQAGCSYGATTDGSDLVNVIPKSEFDAHAAGDAPNKIWFYSDEGATLTVTHVKVEVTREGTPDVSDTSEDVSETSEDVSETSEEASDVSDVDVSDVSDVDVSDVSDVDVSDASDVDVSDISDVDVSDISDVSDTSEIGELVYGDADGDNDVTMKDVLAMRKLIANMEVEINEEAADVDGDGDVTMKDVLLVRKYIAKMITEFPVEAEGTVSDVSDEISDASEEISETSEEVSEEASES